MRSATTWMREWCYSQVGRAAKARLIDALAKAPLQGPAIEELDRLSSKVQNSGLYRVSQHSVRTKWAAILLPDVDFPCAFDLAPTFAVALAQVVWHFMMIRTRARAGCSKAFRLNHWLGFAVFAGIAAS
jgi:hypothetical protein